MQFATMSVKILYNHFLLKINVFIEWIQQGVRQKALLIQQSHENAISKLYFYEI